MIQNTDWQTCCMLHFADDALIMSQRLSQWTGHGPALEEDIALTNIALDLLGQARFWYQEVVRNLQSKDTAVSAFLPNGLLIHEITEDALAFLRTESQFTNHLLVELPNGNWGNTLLQLFFFSQYQKCIYQQLSKSDYPEVAAIAEKSLKEVAYHQNWTSNWVLRLGDGTLESHERMQMAVQDLWPYVGELFENPTSYIGWINYEAVKTEWTIAVSALLSEATLSVPVTSSKQSGGLKGLHTEYMGFLLAEMQYVHRLHPGCTW